MPISTAPTNPDTDFPTLPVLAVPSLTRLTRPCATIFHGNACRIISAPMLGVPQPTPRRPPVFPAEWARHQMIQELTDAWRTPAPTLDAAAVTTAPAGAYAPTGYAAHAGDTCTLNGAPGNLVERAGWLFCEVTQPGPTRSGASAGDAQPGTRAYVDAVWRELQEETQNAWRKQG
jgi:hypothetical protein